MTHTKKHDNTKPCDKSCTRCYPVGPRTSRTRRRRNRWVEQTEAKEASDANI